MLSLYFADSNSAIVKELMRKQAEPLILTSWQRAEFLNASRLAVFRGSSTEALAEVMIFRFEQDITDGYFSAVVLNLNDVLQVAERLSRRHTATTGIRFLDILHLATALQLKARRFLTFDKKQAELAKVLNFEVGP